MTNQIKERIHGLVQMVNGNGRVMIDGKLFYRIILPNCNVRVLLPASEIALRTDEEWEKFERLINK